MKGENATFVSWKVFLSYGVGDFALNLFWQGTSFYLFFFYADVVGLPNKTAGLILFIASVWDAFTDPFVGYLAEKTRSRWGPYRPFLLYGAIPLSVMFVVLFTPVRLDNDLLEAGFYLGILLMFRTAYTFVSIPYSALGARVTRNSQARTKLAGVRMYFGFLGGVVLGLVAKSLLEEYSSDTALFELAIIVGVIAVVALFACFYWTEESSNPINEAFEQVSIRNSLISILSNRPFQILLSAFILVNIGIAIVGQITLFYFGAKYAVPNVGSNAIIILTAMPLFAIPIWTSVALKVGKKHTWVVGSPVSAGGLAVMVVDNSGSVALAYTAISIMAFGFTAYAVVFWSMLPDTIEYGEFHSGVRSESVLIGVASSLQKITIGLTAFVVGILLDMIEFQAGSVSSEMGILGLKQIYTLIPVLVFSISAIVVFYYPISKEMHADLVAGLKKRITDNEKN